MDLICKQKYPIIVYIRNHTQYFLCSQSKRRPMEVALRASGGEGSLMLVTYQRYITVHPGSQTGCETAGAEAVDSPALPNGWVGNQKKGIDDPTRLGLF